MGSGDSAAGGYCADKRSNEVYFKERRVRGFLGNALGEDQEGFLLFIMVKRFPYLGLSLTSAERSFFLSRGLNWHTFYSPQTTSLCCVSCTKWHLQPLKMRPTKAQEVRTGMQWGRANAQARFTHTPCYQAVFTAESGVGRKKQVVGCAVCFFIWVLRMG